MKAKTIFILFLILLVLFVFLQNTEVVDFRLFFWKISMSRIILYPAILIIGFISGYVVAKINRRQLLKNKLRKFEDMDTK